MYSTASDIQSRCACALLPTAVLICRRTLGEIQGVGSPILSIAIRWAPSGRIADHSHAWPYLLATDRAQSYSCRRHGFTPPRPRPAINHDHPSHPLSRDPPILTPLGSAKHCAHLGLSMSYDRTVSLTAPQRDNGSVAVRCQIWSASDIRQSRVRITGTGNGII